MSQFLFWYVFFGFDQCKAAIIFCSFCDNDLQHTWTTILKYLKHVFIEDEKNLIQKGIQHVKSKASSAQVLSKNDKCIKSYQIIFSFWSFLRSVRKICDT